VIDSTPRGARRAALLLHGLNIQDRQWLLQRLGEAQRQQLQGLLDELSTLGVEVDRADIPALLASAPLKAAPLPPAAAPEPEWATWLADEPAWVLAVLRGDEPAAGRVAPAARRALREAALQRRPALPAGSLAASSSASEQADLLATGAPRWMR
jgi:hypothetical protein